jgi:ribonucleoside-diphosphate reductase alpha chain
MRVAGIGVAGDRSPKRAGSNSTISCHPSTFTASTPTLFNSGTLRPQLSSCFLTTMRDDVDAIFEGIKDNALLAKYSDGLGSDWTSVCGPAAHIKGTMARSER